MKHDQSNPMQQRNGWRYRMNIKRKTLSVISVGLGLSLVGVVSGCPRIIGVPVSGMRLSVTKFPDECSRNSIFFLSEDDKLAPGTADDPTMDDPTMFGASLALHSPMTDSFDSYTLPAEGWKALPAPAEGYSYVDVHHTHGPCEYVALTAGRLVATCRGADVKFSLEDPHQEKVNVTFSIGLTRLYCASFGGDVMRDRSSWPHAIGSFLAIHAPAPPDCVS